MGPECYSPEGIHKLEDIDVDECAVGFRDTYEGGEDDRTLQGMLDEINYYSETVIQKV